MNGLKAARSASPDTEKKKPRETVAALDDRQKLLLWVLLLTVCVILAAMAGISLSHNGGLALSGAVPASGKRRSKLYLEGPADASRYTDQLNWLGSANSTAEKALTYFYEQTGVRPYLYLTGNLGTGLTAPTQEVADTYAQELYGTLFRDGNHLLVVVCESPLLREGILTSCAVGEKAAALMDEEACGILAAYLRAAYENRGVYPEGQEDRMLSDVLRSTVKNIMGIKERGVWIWLLAVLLAVVTGVILRDFIKAWRRLKQEKEAAQKEKEKA